MKILIEINRDKYRYRDKDRDREKITNKYNYIIRMKFEYKVE